MNRITRTFRQWSGPIADKAARLLHPQAHAFYMRLAEDGYQPNVLIDVLPDERIVYVCAPKCASARIKKTLCALQGRQIRSSEEAYERQHSGLKNPKRAGLSTFWQVATDPRAVRFSFVRNPLRSTCFVVGTSVSYQAISARPFIYQFIPCVARAR
jgi:hypothetical protein